MAVTLLNAQGAAPSEILPPIDSGGRGDVVVGTAGVVHDLGNLIQIASSALNILARTPEMPAVHAGPILHRARVSLDHAGTIIRHNIAQARDRDAARHVRSDVAACLAEIATLVEAMDEPRLALELQIEPGLPLAACDPVDLRRAVLNLVFNARDAMAGDGMVLIRAHQAGSAIELRVADHGRGMSRATIARVFDPFFTTKADGLGGIGLPMVERFVRGTGGAMTIVSEPGIGTIVTLSLPAALPGNLPFPESDR